MEEENKLNQEVKIIQFMKMKINQALLINLMQEKKSLNQEMKTIMKSFMKILIWVNYQAPTQIFVKMKMKKKKVQMKLEKKIMRVLLI